MRVARHAVDDVCVRMQRRKQPPCTPLMPGEEACSSECSLCPTFDCQSVKACNCTEEPQSQQGKQAVQATMSRNTQDFRLQACGPGDKQ